MGPGMEIAQVDLSARRAHAAKIFVHWLRELVDRQVENLAVRLQRLIIADAI
jgi:hypothetical protein